VDDGALLKHLRVGYFVIYRRRRPHAVAARQINLRAQRVLPFAAEAGRADAGAPARLGKLGGLSDCRGGGPRIGFSPSARAS
jgi:hypothetical protein